MIPPSRGRLMVSRAGAVVIPPGTLRLLGATHGLSVLSVRSVNGVGVTGPCTQLYKLDAENGRPTGSM